MYRIIGADGQQYGPVSVEQLRQWIHENRVNAHTLVQPEGGSDWKPLSTFPELVGEFKSALPPVAPVPPTIAPPPSAFAARATNKIPAGICGILLGAFGVHKFILGYTNAGLIMLLVSLLAPVVTCFSFGFVGTAVMYVIGIIEGIVYLTKTDEEFVRIYVDGRREWF